MKWRLIKQALCPLKARNPHKAGLLNPVLKRVYESQGEETRRNVEAWRKRNEFV